MANNVYKQLSEQRKKAERDIAERSLLKIWSYFNSLKNIDKTNLLKNIQRGQALYYAPVREIKGSRLVNIPKKGEIYVDEKFMQEHPLIATFQITHECLHGVSLVRDGEQVSFGHSAKGGSDTNKYNGVLEACTQMFAEDAEGRRLSENEDYLYYVKNIMRAIRVVFGEDKLADQFLGNNTNFEMDFNSFSEYKFEDFNKDMSNIYLLERKKERNKLSTEEIQLLENYKSNLNKSVAKLIKLKSKEKPEIYDTIVNEIQDEKFSSQLNPSLVVDKVSNINEDKQQIQQEENVQDFVLKFVESYKQLESDAQYNKRVDREESDIELVVEYLNLLRTGKINNIFFGGIQPGEMEKNGRIDFSQNNIDRMFRLLNAANNITIGKRRYVSEFCASPEIKELLEQMQQSPKVQEMLSVAEIERTQGKQSKASLRDNTPFEKQKEIAEHISNIRTQAKQLKNEADMILQNAKQKVERMILGK